MATMLVEVQAKLFLEPQDPVAEATFRRING